ncbi:MAG: type II secretion system F family protein [Cryobacterium sp.]
MRGASARRAAGTPLATVATVAQRLAVLLAAGVSPASAWSYLLPEPGAPHGENPAAAPVRRRSFAWWAARGFARDSAGHIDVTTERVLRAAAAAGARGESVADAVAAEARDLGGQIGEAWLGLAAAWQVATDSGAPLAGCLRQLARSFRDLAQLHRDFSVALAGPAATARMVMLLPLVGILLGATMGFNALQTLLFTLPGLVCLGLGSGLLVVAGRWNRKLLARAQKTRPAPGLHLDLMAIALAGGGSVDRARALVTAATENFATPGTARGGRADEADEADGAEGALVSRVLALAVRAGVPAAELLRSEAEQCRQDARTEGQRRSAALGVTLMLPLGVCVLPAFMLVGVVPLLVSVLSSTLTPV